MKNISKIAAMLLIGGSFMLQSYYKKVEYGRMK